MPRRGENIFKRKDGRWEARFVKEITIDGNKKYGSVYAPTYREVKAKQQLYINQPQLAEQRFQDKRLEMIMAEWLDENKNQLKISSYRKYQAIVQNHISQIGNLPIRHITDDTISQFTDSLLSQENLLSRETVNQILIVLGMGLDFAKERYKAIIPEIHLLKCAKQSIRVLSPLEQQILVKHLLEQDDVFSFGILIALYTGMRIGEVCALKWENISAETIHICKTMQRLKTDNNKTEVMILPPKTDSSDRVIPIPRALLSTIFERRKASGFILLQNNGKIVEPRLLQNKFAKIAEACKLENVHFHTLRHTFATRCIEAGVDIKTLSEILGHSDVKTTLNKYVHSSLELKQSCMDKLTLGA